MSADLSELPSTQQPHSLSANLTRSSGFLSYSHRDTRNMSMDELEEEYQQLRDENHQLQLRILGVNELARLLQDKNEQLQLVEEKNKRLEVAVVRLENRCSNIEKMSKNQKGGPTSLPSKTGQSPFIPGPSRQILEGLMKENSELKKTLNSLTRKGASGYLEAVKITQLEEVIDCQKDELQFTRDQIRQLTGGDTDSKDNSGGLSLPSNVSDTGPLKRQLIKLQHATKVKDRFCALLSQQIAELQGKLSVAQQQAGQSDTLTKATPQVEQTDAPSGMQARYEKLLEDKTNELDQLRTSHASSLEKLERVDRELKIKAKEADDVDKLRDQLDLYISEKGELLQTLEIAQKDLEMLMSKDSGAGGMEGGISMEAFKKMERERDDLRKVLEDQSNQATEQRQSYETELLVLKTQLENEEYKRAIASSDMEHKINVLGQEKAELNRDIDAKDDKITELQDDIDCYKSDVTELRDELNQTKIKMSKIMQSPQGLTIASRGTYGNSSPSGISNDGSIIFSPNKAGMMVAVKDGPSGDSRYSANLHCEKPISHQDIRTPVISRDARSHERPTQLPPNQSYQQYPPPNMGRSSPSMTPGSYYSYGTPITQQPPPRGMLNPGYRSPGMSGMYSRPGNPPMQMPSKTPTGQQPPSSPFRTYTQPISTPVPMVTSPTYMRPGSYPQIVQTDHPLTTSSSIYSQGGGVMFSQPGQRRGGPPPSGGMRQGHPYHQQRPDDETSIPGGQRSPSPNPRRNS
ncbi:uncharacterized protein LOC135335337 isoform X2 [Halichondria panicea]|uniref:uncharacterized protein LOC135335337 isoform X2 n=1 Tax=Halichondria panicea TaxID=6063 RepID=UPI00312B347D